MPSQKAFTLIELSIVLVIIGLVVGGILVGRELINNAENRKVISDVEKYRTVTNTFRTKYNCLAGDCPNATSFFGTDSSGCPSGGGSTGTCDGDGNGLVLWNGENFRAIQQYALAGLLAGNYTGILGTASTPGVNILATGFGGGIQNYHMTAWGNATGGDSNRLIVGKAKPADTNSYSILSPNNLKNIDIKLDDGLPITGRLYGRNGTDGGTCVSSNTYLNSDDVECCFTYKLDY
jgi:prepilin-type N-terminal cleavage/methylation domain-containing protein